ncbi:Metallo-dependent phosphatase [Leucogyrophana mollusca]|uniref:Metallo-dependent phosphatase n=1 Tax=Leucogyrophana mollusca TaxID=85980 RepID=A0ACB8BKZ0_9AGAM|nr:Metallo-dependent phosphatase [Leucogyrophana mollusca]
MSLSSRVNIRQYLAGSVLACFVVFFLTSGIQDELSGWTGLLHKPEFPEFSQFKLLETLTPEQFPINDSNRRIIAIGDIHGMNASLQALLSELSYNSEYDTLIHLGDIITKAPVEGSLAVLSFMSSNKILGVRGNNDQKVIEWRAWMDWVLSLPGGEDWLIQMDKKWPKYHLDDELDSEEEDDLLDSTSSKSWGDRVPKGWLPLQKHYKVARAMTHEHYEYLLSLPLVLYAPAGHTYFVHAGLLPSDPSLRPRHPNQPLSHWPSLFQVKPDADVLRGLQEVALLQDVPQNSDPYVVTNMRGVKNNNKITESSSKGTPWSDLWNGMMGRCAGFDALGTRDILTPNVASFHVDYKIDKASSKALPCYPSTVVYGHAASRGLDIKRWSVGIDSGCIYGRRLTALVLDRGSFHSSSPVSDFVEDESSPVHSRHIPYGDNGQARIVSIKCR